MNKLSDDITNTWDSNKTFTHLSTIIKELVENSIDAKATSISIFLVNSCLSLIEVKDNGTGIPKETLVNLCKRFSSSKISSYSDLSSWETFGFRGEALSILSYISTLTIISKYKDESIGYEACFRNGRIQNENWKPIPIETGTWIKVENIFYNNPIRKTVYEKNKNSEIEDIINTISKIAYHYIHISFSLSIGNYTNKILCTCNDSNETPWEIRKKLSIRLFKQNVNDDLFKFDNYSTMNDQGPNEGNDTQNKTTTSLSVLNWANMNSSFKFECYYTKPSASVQSSNLILFVNNRLVKNAALSKVFEQAYSKFWIKKGNYFAYLSITCDPEMIDVNVAANKSVVFFLNEDSLFEHLQNYWEEQWKEEINSKNYYVGMYKGANSSQTKIVNTCDIIYNKEDNEKVNVYAKDKVRIDNKTVSIERFISLNQIGSKRKEQAKTNSNNNNNHNHNNNTNTNNNTTNNQIDNIPTQAAIHSTIFNKIYPSDKTEINDPITRIFKNHFFIGYDNVSSWIYIQHLTSLYLVNAKNLLSEYFFYLYITDTNYKETVKIKNSSYTITDILQFVKDNFPSKRDAVDSINADRGKLTGVIFEKISVLMEGIIGWDNESGVIKKICLINTFNHKKYIRNAVNYLPMIYFSIIECLFFEEKEIGQSNENLNKMVEIFKILSHYLANSYWEYINTFSNDEFGRQFIRDVLLDNIKNDNRFYIRRNLKEKSWIEKIIDTETWYTVFERC